MATLDINKTKLATSETVRYQGPGLGQQHGVYHLRLFTGGSEPNVVDIHLSLEALIQLKQRLDAALQHMITH